MIVSKTAYQNGFGTDRYKSVAELSKDEKHMLKLGQQVYFKSSARSGGNYGTYWRKVQYRNGYFNPRVPNAQEIEQLEKM